MPGSSFPFSTRDHESQDAVAAGTIAMKSNKRRHSLSMKPPRFRPLQPGSGTRKRFAFQPLLHISGHQHAPAPDPEIIPADRVEEPCEAGRREGCYKGC